MIEINLLPEKPKKKEAPFKMIGFSGLNLENVAFLKIGIAVVIVLAALHSSLYIVGALSGSKMDALGKKYNALLPKKAEADALKIKMESMYKKGRAIDLLMVKRFSWAKKLNALSDSMTPGIWLSELDYYEAPNERPVGRSAVKGKLDTAGAPSEKMVIKYLMISGYASSMGEQGTALIGKFIKSLKENSGFYSDLSEIELKSIKTDKIGAQEVMNFKISCLFKE
ncbi:MAG: hypothetical protein Q8N91_00700 [Candidatus Omnitrophota bacterium]|nr:hypothetical protein [Candidatus Omnitrophota bacterium]